MTGLTSLAAGTGDDDSRTAKSYPWKRAIVVGASSGIGEQVARLLAGSGCRVALVGRRREELERICGELNREYGSDTSFPIEHDVRSQVDLTGLFQDITSCLVGLDLIVYTAGITPRVGPREYRTDVDRDTIDTNLTGAVAWLNEAAHRFDRAGEGTIVGVGSVAGDRGRRGNPVYGATKAALATYLESLRNRLSVRGVTVTTVKPGYVRTAQIEGIPLPAFFPVLSPEEAARQILDGAAARKTEIYVPDWWRFVMLMIRGIPSPIMRRLNF